MPQGSEHSYIYLSHTPATLYITIFQQVCSSIKNIANINQNKHVLSSSLLDYRKSDSNKVKLD